MNVLSLFDGISCGRVALERAGVKVDNYYASEIFNHAITITQKNYPDTIQIGNVCDVDGTAYDNIGLLMGGSPCQGFSFAGKQLNFDDPRSKLFFEYARVLNECKPKYFLLENVVMKQEYQDIISIILGVEPIMINSSLVSAHTRKRLYWTNIPNVCQPDDKNIDISDILSDSFDDKYYIKDDYFDGTESKLIDGIWRIQDGTKRGYTEVLDGECVDLTFKTSNTRRGRHMKHKSNCMTKSAHMLSRRVGDKFRKLTPVECERLQTLQDGYTEGIPDTHRYGTLGDGWTVDVIAHIMRNINADSNKL